MPENSHSHTALWGYALFGFVLGVIATYDVNKLERRVKELEAKQKTTVQKEAPTLSHIDGMTGRSFYDYDLDGKTVERYQETVFGDYGTGVAGKVIIDIERDSMTKRQKDLIDRLYKDAQEARKAQSVKQGEQK